MKEKIKYTDGPIGKTRRIRDLLPPPHMLVFKEDAVKVTMVLSKSSIDFFKREAKKCRAPYQKMIRSLIDTYVRHQSLKPADKDYRRSEQNWGAAVGRETL